ncbi:MAG: M23 family metallopeptidase [Gemmatimonadaceae bacterium]
MSPSDVLNSGGGKVQSDPARHRRRMIAPAVAATLIGGCTGGGEAPSARAESRESTAVAQTHVNGAVLDSALQRSSRSRSRAANGAAANGGASALAGASPSNGDAISATDAGRPATLPGGSPAASTSPRDTASSTAVAPTPDELSALAASLVVPVAGVTPAELHGSFHAPRGGGSRQHNALDIPAPRGTPVISATAGRVLRLFNSKAGGLMVYAADPTERFILMYGHLDRYAEGLKDGMRLQRGQTIGYVGTTGNAPVNVPHLHFAISRTNNVDRWWAGTPIDPAPLFKR